MYAIYRTALKFVASKPNPKYWIVYRINKSASQPRKAANLSPTPASTRSITSSIFSLIQTHSRDQTQWQSDLRAQQRAQQSLEQQLQETRRRASEAINRFNVQSVTMNQQSNEIGALRQRLTKAMRSQPARRHVFNMGGDEPEEVSAANEDSRVGGHRYTEKLPGEDQHGLRAAAERSARPRGGVGANSAGESGNCDGLPPFFFAL